MPSGDKVPITLAWGTSAMATLTRIIASNPALSLEEVKQHAAVAGLVSETTVEIYVNTGPWVLTSLGDTVRLTHDALGFGTEWASDSANSGRTLPTCKGAFFVDGDTPRWIVLCKSFHTSKGNTFLELPLAAGVHIATNIERGVLLADCFGPQNDLQMADLICGAKNATLRLVGALPTRRIGMRILISIPLGHSIPISVHIVPGCDRVNNIEEYFDRLLRESNGNLDPLLGFAGLLGFNHPNMGLTTAIEESGDARSRTFSSVRRRLDQRSDDPDVVSTVLELAGAWDLPHNVSSTGSEFDSTGSVVREISRSNAAEANPDDEADTARPFAVGRWITHKSGVAAGLVLESDAFDTTIASGSVKFTAGTDTFTDAPSFRESASTAADSGDRPATLANQLSGTGQKRTFVNVPRGKAAAPIELQIAQRAMQQFANDRNGYLKYVFDALRREVFPLGLVPLRRALQSLRNAVYLSPKEAEAIWVALLGSR